MAMPWFRMYAEFASDPKVQMMSEAMQRRLVMLFCMRCCDVTVTLRDDEIAFHLRVSESELAETKALFIAKGFIDSEWNVTNWEKRQFASDSSAERTRRYRDRKRDANVTSHVTARDAVEQIQNRTDTEATEAKASVVPEASGTRCPHADIIALYHETLPSLARVREWTDARQALLRKRWAEKPERQTLDWWRDFFGYVERSDFLMGRKASRGSDPFECDLEWLIRPRNFVKVIEGKYENRGAAA
jgi:hypothetical protein